MSKRIKALKASFKRREDGNFPERAWYVNTNALEEQGLSSYKAPEGDNFIRFVPPTDDEAPFGLEIKVHYGIGVNGSAFLCPKFLGNGPCPICNKVQELKTVQKQSEVADESLAKTISGLWAKTRYLYWIIDMTSDETEKIGVQLYDACPTIEDGIIGVSRDQRTKEIIDISDPDEGLTLIFTRKGLGPQNTTYKAFKSEEANPLSDEILDSVVDFENILEVHDYNTIKAEFEGGLVPDEEEELEEVLQPRRRERPAPKEEEKDIELTNAEEDSLEESDEVDEKSSRRDKIKNRLKKVKNRQREESTDAETKTPRRARR